MSSNLNELQNATVGMTCGVIEVRVAIVDLQLYRRLFHVGFSSLFWLTTFLHHCFFFFSVRRRRRCRCCCCCCCLFIMTYNTTGADFAALQLLQKHGATATKDLAQPHGHVSRRGCE
jgi:hypothetical protein